jgi:uncharacterized repeat protein (TIGR01451 family)
MSPPAGGRPPSRRAPLAGFVGVLLGSLLLPGLVAAAASASAPAAAAPQLSIAIDNGKKSVVQGDRSSYTITVHNIGTGPVKALRITQTIPAGLKLIAAQDHGKSSAGQVTWTVDLAAGASKALHTTALVQATPAELLQLATVACATASKQTRPLVCATHSDQLPAGKAAAAAAVPEAASAHSAKSHWPAILESVGATAVIAALGTMLVLRRKGAHRA